jgi:hypothetical protein
MSIQSDRRKKLFQRCKEVGLTREERLELACYLLRRDVVTFQSLDEDQVCRLLDALEGHELIQQLLSMRTPA